MKKSWLLIKIKDEWAIESTELSAAPTGVKATRRKTKAKAAQRASISLDMPDPELAVLVDHPPEGEGWIFEQKFDGYRIFAQVGGGSKSPRLASRNGIEWTKKFAPIADALKKLKVRSALLDGEVVALNEKGLSDFQALQNILSEPQRGKDLLYYAFDLLELDGKDLRSLPLKERREKLAGLLQGTDSKLIVSESLKGDGRKLFSVACQRGWEGLLCKRADAPYREGRTEDWLKVKCTQRQEFIVIGYTEPQGARKHFGALVLGSRDLTNGGDIRYVGKVGTGFGTKLLAELGGRLKKLAQAKPTVQPAPAIKGVHWVKPELVAEISYTEFTKDGILRHPSFEGLREDKNSKDVKIEKAVAPPHVDEAETSADTYRSETVGLTHPERVLFVDRGTTKLDLASYYQLASERMLALIAGRPLSLKRCPQGVEGECFFQQNARSAPGKGTSLVQVSADGKDGSRVQIDDPRGLRTLAQLGVLEIHMWSSRSRDLESPDQLIFDLDPDPKTPWEKVVEGACALKEVLESEGLTTFIKVSGSKGVHLHVPLKGSANWQNVHSYSEQIAQRMEKEASDLFTASSLKKNRVGRIYLDYVRNSRGVTSIAPYSTRAKIGGPIALPIFWDEFGRRLKPDQFTIRNVAHRLKDKQDDPWLSFDKDRSELPVRPSAKRSGSSSTAKRKSAK